MFLSTLAYTLPSYFDFNKHEWILERYGAGNRILARVCVCSCAAAAVHGYSKYSK